MDKLIKSSVSGVEIMRFMRNVAGLLLFLLCLSYSYTQADENDFLLPPPPPPVAGGLELPPPPPPSTSDTAVSTDVPAVTQPATPELTLPTVSDTVESTEVDIIPAPAPVAADNTLASVDITASAQDLGGVAGKITGGRVNIRAGQSTKYEIVLTADIDTPVVVFEKVGDWIKIAYPETEFCYINQRYLKGDIPADIPEQGLVREVQGTNVNLRARPWPGSTVIGQVNSGESVFVTGVRGQWVRIRPPASARAWVFYKYVSYTKDGVKETIVTKEERSGDELDEFGNKIKVAADDIVEQAKQSPLLLKIRARAEAERKIRDQRRAAVDNILNSVEDQMARIEEESQIQKEEAYKRSKEMRKAQEAYAMQLADDYRPGSPPGSMGYDATGWVEYVGYVNNRNAGYRLVKGGEVIYMLRSLYYDLDEFVGKHIRVSGKIINDPTSNYDILDVRKLSLYNGTYIRPNTGLAPDTQTTEGFVDYEVRENVTIETGEGFEPMIIQDEIIEERRIVPGSSVDVTGLIIDEQ